MLENEKLEINRWLAKKYPKIFDEKNGEILSKFLDEIEKEINKSINHLKELEERLSAFKVSTESFEKEMTDRILERLQKETQDKSWWKFWLKKS